LLEVSFAFSNSFIRERHLGDSNICENAAPRYGVAVETYHNAFSPLPTSASVKFLVNLKPKISCDMRSTIGSEYPSNTFSVEAQFMVEIVRE
jgi:hypothetical protein